MSLGRNDDAWPATWHDHEVAEAEQGEGAMPERHGCVSAMVDLSAVVESQREFIAERWLSRLGEAAPDQSLSRTEALDSLIEVLGELGKRLRAAGQDARQRPCLRGAELAREHGEQRFRLGFSDEAIVVEYQILREEILRTAVEAGIEPRLEFVLALSGFVDMMVANAIHAHTACRERTQHEFVAEHVRQSERKLSQLFSMMPFYAALARGPRHEIELLTEPLKALWGGRDAVGVPHHEAYPELGTEHFEIWDRVYASGEPFRANKIKAEVQVKEGQTEVRFFDLTLMPRRDAEAGIEGVAAFAFDVTDQVVKEDALRRASQHEQQLLGIVSHDLRNPLGAIAVGTQALLRRSDLPDTAVRTLLRVQSSAERAVRLVRDLLDFTQARLGEGIQARRQKMDMHEVAGRVVEELQMAHPQRQIDVRARGQARGCWDPDRMEQIIGNLLSNALKYSPQETPISVCITGHEEDVVITVHNWGPPIPERVRGRLFEPLERGEEAGDVGRSIGLGLFIVKHLVEAHGGHVEVESEAGTGTTFRVHLSKAEKP